MKKLLMFVLVAGIVLSSSVAVVPVAAGTSNDPVCDVPANPDSPPSDSSEEDTAEALVCWTINTGKCWPFTNYCLFKTCCYIKSAPVCHYHWEWA